jgi:tetratricopeptide (TPR) repeat protein
MELAPALPEDISPRDLDQEVRDELRSLASTDANLVARHLVATGQLLDDEPEAALAHARAARRIAPRIAAVREALGLAAYHNGEWQSAIAELRTYHRLTGRQSHLAVIADSERALGRPERAVDIFRTAERSKMASDEAVELLIVAASARGDLGQRDAAVAMLQVRELTAASREPWVARLRYAYAEALLAAGRRDEAREWFARAADIDDELATDAAERLLDLDGVVLDDVDVVFEDEDERDESDDETAGLAVDAVDAVDEDDDLDEAVDEDDDLDDDVDVVEEEDDDLAEAEALEEEDDDEDRELDEDRDSGVAAAGDTGPGDEAGEHGPGDEAGEHGPGGREDDSR